MRVIPWLIVLLCTPFVPAQGFVLKEVTFVAPDLKDEVRINISAVAVSPDKTRLAIGGDEGREVYLLKRAANGSYVFERSLTLDHFPEKEEVDIEGIAWSQENGRLYVCGSHSRSRHSLDSEKPLEKNRERLQEIRRREATEQIYEFRINENPMPKPKRISLKDRIAADPVLGAFAALPCKENGIDIEALAATKDQLFVGFRGPVLHEGHVAVLGFDFDKPEKAKTYFLNLGGRGIRDMVRIKNGFLLIGGPVHVQPYSFNLYFWSDDDLKKQNDVEAVEPKLLGEIPLPGPKDKIKAEGLTVMPQNENSDDLEILMVFDGLDLGGPHRFTIKKP